jgi:hypothetical protein
VDAPKPLTDDTYITPQEALRRLDLLISEIEETGTFEWNEEDL